MKAIAFCDLRVAFAPKMKVVQVAKTEAVKATVGAKTITVVKKKG